MWSYYDGQAPKLALCYLPESVQDLQGRLWVEGNPNARSTWAMILIIHKYDIVLQYVFNWFHLVFSALATTLHNSPLLGVYILVHLRSIWRLYTASNKFRMTVRVFIHVSCNTKTYGLNTGDSGSMPREINTPQICDTNMLVWISWILINTISLSFLETPLSYFVYAPAL